MKIKSIKDFGASLTVIFETDHATHTFQIQKGEKTEDELESEIRAQVADRKGPGPRSGTEVSGKLALLKDEDF